MFPLFLPARRAAFAVLLLVTVALAAACGGGGGGSASEDGASRSSAAGETVTLRLGMFANITHAPGLYGLREGVFERVLGDRVRIEVKTFNAGPAVIEALYAGDIDIAYIGPNPAINGFVQSNGQALRIIAGSTSGGASLVVRSGAGIASAADFSGKRVATPQLGNTQDVALRTWLLQNGLKAREQGGNVTIIPSDNATTLALFQRGEVDAAWVPEPWATRLVMEAGGVRLLDERTLWPGGSFVTTNVIARTGFLRQHADVVEAFLRAHIEAVRLVREDPARARTVTAEAIRDITGATLPPEVLEEAWSRLDFTYDPLAASLRKSALNAVELGFFGGRKLSLDGIYDLEPLNRALSSLGMPGVAP